MLYQELMAAQSICEGAKDTIEEWGADDDSTAAVPVYESYPVYELHLKDLGTLTGEEIELVMEAYRYIVAKPETLMHIGNFVRSEGRLICQVPPQYRSLLVNLNASVLDKIQPATNALRQHLPRRDLAA